MQKLSQNFDFIQIEQKLCQYWQLHKIYSWDSSETKEVSYVIDTPPPTISGQLHIGHIFSYNHTDFIARFQRMKGRNVFYPMGFDNNGLPTERLVENQKGVKAKEMSREDFIKLCEEVIIDEEKKFEQLFLAIGLSVDWDQRYTTISKNSRLLSQMSFLDLLAKNQIYRNIEPVLWDVVDQTAISQAEIEDKEKSSVIYDIEFLSENKVLTIATTRPELLPACVALLYNPQDQRYKEYQGKFAISPLFKVKVPIVADNSVAIEKGTGLVMCCTFGDITDVMWWKQHKFPLRTILSKVGRIEAMDFNDISIEPKAANELMQSFVGLTVSAARGKVVALLKEHQVIVKELAINHMVKCAERSGAALEILPTYQWFIKSLDHKEALFARSAELNWHPKSMKIKLDNWINSVSWDWCISRQRYFGVPFPIWYSKRAGEEGKILLPDIKQLPVNPIIDLPYGYNKEEVEADFDVMDTWATSAISPQLNSLAISQNFAIDAKRHEKLFPADLRPQAHEIIRTWAFGTILKAHLHENKLPWKNIMISGWCLAEDKSKMSKSKGNVITPEKLLKEYGADVIRYWASNARLGSDTTFSQDVINNGKRLINKLWNSAKFVELHIANLSEDNIDIHELLQQNIICCSSDKAIIAKLSKVRDKVNDYLEQYEYSLAREAIEQFFWQDFCDNYIEIVKGRIYNNNHININWQESAQYTIKFCFEIILKLFAPFLPYITEELYQNMFDIKSSIHARYSWPSFIIEKISDEDILQYASILQILNDIRKAKSEKNLSMKTPINSLLINSSKLWIPDSLHDLTNVTNTVELKFKECGAIAHETLISIDF